MHSWFPEHDKKHGIGRFTAEVRIIVQLILFNTCLIKSRTAQLSIL